MKKILFLGNSYLVILKFRKELITKLISLGNIVYVSFPNSEFGSGETVERDFGAKYIETHVDRRGKSIINDFRLLKEYKDLIRKLRPDFVLSFTVKSDIYGGFACRKMDTVFIPNITGLGKGLTEKGIVQIILKYLYKLSLSKAECVFFQNRSDMSFFCSNKIIDSKKRFAILPGSGVNLDEYKIVPMPSKEKTVFLFIGRIMQAKGIDEFLEAAKILKNSKVEFHICGFCEENYTEKLKKYAYNKIIIYHGLVNDVTKYIYNSHCIVLPSFHPEGISNVLLEAGACGRPVITTNNPGCRETVDDNITGFLIDSQNVLQLVRKMKIFINMNVDQVSKMGVLARKKMESEFDRKIVVKKYLNEMQIKE